ncbi:MAG: 23S rRNA (uracil(1939)-C(5))-methyltransferase RlmD [Cyanobacteria bacterium P01_H01_bin.15]
MQTLWQQGTTLEVEIEDLSHSGDGVARHDNRVIFISDSVTGDRVRVRLTHIQPSFTRAKLQEIVDPSEHRRRPRCIVADKCGGCQWQHIEDSYQQAAKKNQLIQTLQRVGGFEPGSYAITEVLTGDSFAYRNKATYPLSRNQQGQVKAGYFRRGSHQIVNLNQCPIQDHRLNPLLADIKKDIEAQGWSIYNEKEHRGRLRHLGLRIGRRTGEMLLTLISTVPKLPGLPEQAELWLERYPDLVGVLLNHNPKRGNVIFGDAAYLIAGRDFLTEIFADLTFRLRPETFFQVNTDVAEALLKSVAAELPDCQDKTLLDAYCGIGTFSLPLAHRFKQVIGVEVQQQSVTQALVNTEINQIDNATFITSKLADWCRGQPVLPEVILLDPPRKGCDRETLECIASHPLEMLIYISCQPATLARDLKYLCEQTSLQLMNVKPADFFPQTPHLECAAILKRF